MNQQDNDDSKLLTICIKLPPENIVLLKFILESYEGLGIVRTLNSERGEILILSTIDNKENIFGLIESIKSECKLEIVDNLDFSGDWLADEISFD